MPKKGSGWTNLTVRVEVKHQLEAIYKKDDKRPPNQTFNAYIDNFLMDYIDYNKKLREYGAFLEFNNAFDNHILLTDNFLHKPVVVTVKAEAKKLWCETHDNDCCVHIGFCFGIKKVYEKLIDNGFRPPK